MQLRAAGSLTVARPEKHAPTPAIYTDVTGGRSRFGNPELQPTSIAHLDLRWEWYPSSASPTDLISVAAFAKHFDRPVETVITSGADMAVTYANAPRAGGNGAVWRAKPAPGAKSRLAAAGAGLG